MTDAARENGPGRRAHAFLRRTPRWMLVAVGVVLAVLLGYLLLRATSTEEVRVRNLPDRPLTPGAVEKIRVDAESLGRAQILIDDQPVATQRQQDTLGLRTGGAVSDGPHELRVEIPRSPAWLGSDTATHEFTVDSRSPSLRVQDSLRPKQLGQPVTVTGKAKGATKIEVAGKSVTPSGDGTFRARVSQPDREVKVTAKDRAGNTASETMPVHIQHPGMRAVHMSGMAWTSDTLREPVLEMARQGKIDTVELDIKDESGEVPYDSQVPTAQAIGASKGYYDAREAVDELHGMGVRVVGRLVAFKDPIYGEASWHNGHPERVVQSSDGQPWQGGYGDFAFTNFADPAVREYNIAIAREAAKLGFDDILYDYVRRPDGDINTMKLSGLDTTPEKSIAGFLRDSQEAVRSHDALLGASVFGIAVDRPTEIAQDVRQMSHYVDYIAPMVYPSHWASGEFGVDDPNSRPYEIVRRSLAEFAKAVRGTDVEIIPWLQDFSLGVDYGPTEVKAQIDASRANGMDSFLLWAPNCRYHGDGMRSEPR